MEEPNRTYLPGGWRTEDGGTYLEDGGGWRTEEPTYLEDGGGWRTDGGTYLPTWNLTD
jgi:hypothetical protein